MSRTQAPRSSQTGTASKTITSTRKVSRLPIDRQRAEFLRSCRARIKPADLGLPAPQRKRTEGLRREDVAALSGVSVAWYTWLEQGRDMRVSDEVLERISHTFRLSEDERTYLFTLVQRRPPRLHRTPGFEAPEELLHMIDAVALPAILLNIRWDVLAWNRLNSVFFRDYGSIPPAERNLAELLFTRPTYHRNPSDFDEMARRVLAKLRVDYSNSGNDPKFEALVRRLETVSPIFRRMWRTPEINVKSYGMHQYLHERYGELAFEHTSYEPAGHPTLRLVLCTPADARTREAVERARTEPE